MNDCFDDFLLKDFEEYSGNFEDSKEAIHLKTCYLKSAERIVFDYLGYDPNIRSYEETFSGIGDKKLYLHSCPIESVDMLMINGKIIDVSEIACRGSYIYFLPFGKVFPVGIDNIFVSYCAGYRRLPELIRTTILRIATLLLIEAGENIGVTSKSFADNSRTFINYTNYSKYLEPLDPMRIIRFQG